MITFYKIVVSHVDTVQDDRIIQDKQKESHRKDEEVNLVVTLIMKLDLRLLVINVILQKVKNMVTFEVINNKH